eukprot:6352475-Amphidinium_carterae.1
MGKRLRKQTRPLSVAEVKLLEEKVFADDVCVAVFAGFLCLLVHARLRFSDGLRLRNEFAIDCDPGDVDQLVDFACGRRTGW